MTSDGEAAFLWTWRTLGGAAAQWDREYRFDPPRRWRFDLANPEFMVAVEIEGGTWTGGRHVRGDGYARDCRKYNRAAALGWRVFRLTTDMASDPEVVLEVMNALVTKVPSRN